jgi:uncharacterized protein YfcZ (UPF0381/DUF406 family)
MALRDQPYLPLYIQDFLTDEKLMECSAEATGVYVRIMCIMHKSEDYGKILLKQKDKQSTEQTLNFALKIAKQMPYPLAVVQAAIKELLDEKVLHVEGDFLCQKRMIKDHLLSLSRSQAGSKGGKFAQAKLKAKEQANTEYENEIENEIEDVLKKGVQGETKEELFTRLFLDEQWTINIQKTHVGKDFSVGWDQCHLHHSQSPRPPETIWEWRQKFSTWLSIMKPSESSKGPGTKKKKSFAEFNKGKE